MYVSLVSEGALKGRYLLLSSHTADYFHHSISLPNVSHENIRQYKDKNPDPKEPVQVYTAQTSASMYEQRSLR